MESSNLRLVGHHHLLPDDLGQDTDLLVAASQKVKVIMPASKGHF